MLDGLAASPARFDSPFHVDLLAGRHITDSDLSAASPVCVIGQDLVDNLLPGVDPVGKEVRWNNVPCQVIGVGKKKGKTLGQSLDNYVMIPITTYLKQYGAHKDSVRISGKAASAGAPLSEAVDEAREPLDEQYDLLFAA